MSREIKLRAWCPERHEMFPVLNICFDGRPMITVRYRPVVKIPVDFLYLMQYTGLKDKNGKEIYEGDIIRLQANPSHGVAQILFGEYKLANFTKHDIQREHWGFYIEYNGQVLSLAYSIKTPKGYGSSTHSLEVIGNIHENPELLGETK